MFEHHIGRGGSGSPDSAPRRSPLAEHPGLRGRRAALRPGPPISARALALTGSLTLAIACSATPTGQPVGGNGGQGGTPVASGGGGAGAGNGGEGGLLPPIGGSAPCGMLQCSADLHSIVDCNGVVQQTCPDDQGCSPDLTCIPACDAAKASKSTVGCEYYSQQVAFYGCYAVFIANTWTSPVSIAADNNGTALDVSSFARIPTGSGLNITYTPLPGGQLPPKEVAILFLSGFSGACPPGVAPPGIGQNQPIHVTTSAPVVAYDIDPYGGGNSAVTSASLLLPTSAWDLNYVAVAPWPFGFNSQNPRLTIVASEDGTEVTINPVKAITGGMLGSTAVTGTAAGVPATYMMNKGQALTFEQQEELTGSPILATKPIGVQGSSGCINIDACCCDGAHQQIPPVKAFGNEYVSVRYRNRVEGKEESVPWRVVGAVDGTALSYDPAAPVGAPAMINLGEVAEFRAPGPFVIKSQDVDHPFYLSTYMTGAGDFMDIGDPEFVNVIPAQQYLSSYVFFADPTYPETNLVVVRKKGKDGTFKPVTLDCAGELGGWQGIDVGDQYQYTRFDLVRFNFEKQGACDNGRHEMKSDGAFGLTVWGWGTHATEPAFVSTYVSYAYPAGASVQPINDVVVLPDPE